MIMTAFSMDSTVVSWVVGVCYILAWAVPAPGPVSIPIPGRGNWSCSL